MTGLRRVKYLYQSSLNKYILRQIDNKAQITITAFRSAFIYRVVQIVPGILRNIREMK